MKNYKVYDISMEIKPDMMVFENEEEGRPEFQYSTFDEGRGRATKLNTSVHTGTHLDAPRHMLTDGNTIEKTALDTVVCWCKVLDLTSCQDVIQKEDLERFQIEKGDFLLLKTRNSWEKRYDFHFPYVNRSAASYLIEKGVIGIGIDSLSIERAQADFPTHRNLMKHNINILEGLRLKEVEEGEYFLSAAPIKIAGSDGGFVRAVLVKFEMEG